MYCVPSCRPKSLRRCLTDNIPTCLKFQIIVLKQSVHNEINHYNNEGKDNAYRSTGSGIPVRISFSAEYRIIQVNNRNNVDASVSTGENIFDQRKKVVV